MSKAPVTTVIDLLRHGEVEGGSKYRGQQDDPLTSYGWQQLRDVTSQPQQWQQIITSPLKRCSDFADELAERHSLPIEKRTAFKEISFGLWEGKTAEQLLTSDEQAIRAYWNDPVNSTPPQGENLLTFANRVQAGWDELLSEFQGKHLLLICHAGVMRVIICHVLGMPFTEIFKLDVGLATVSRIQIDYADGVNWPRLIFHGSHLND